MVEEQIHQLIMVTLLLQVLLVDEIHVKSSFGLFFFNNTTLWYFSH
jgi:hypothetical protein